MPFPAWGQAEQMDIMNCDNREGILFLLERFAMSCRQRATFVKRFAFGSYTRCYSNFWQTVPVMWGVGGTGQTFYVQKHIMQKLTDMTCCNKLRGA